MQRNIFTGKERRGFARLVMAIKVDFKINGENGNTPWHSGETRNISPQGICLITDLFSIEKWEEIMQRKNHLYLRIYIPKEKERIEAEAVLEKIDVEAEVIWHRRENKEEKELLSLGLNFIDIEKASQDILKRYIVDNLIKKYNAT